MNRADLVAAAVEHLLPTPRLLLFGELRAADAPPWELAARPVVVPAISTGHRRRSDRHR